MFLFEEIDLAKKYNSYALLPAYIQQNINPKFTPFLKIIHYIFSLMTYYNN